MCKRTFASTTERILPRLPQSTLFFKLFINLQKTIRNLPDVPVYTRSLVWLHPFILRRWVIWSEATASLSCLSTWATWTALWSPSFTAGRVNWARARWSWSWSSTSWRSSLRNFRHPTNLHPFSPPNFFFFFFSDIISLRPFALQKSPKTVPCPAG